MRQMPAISVSTFVMQCLSKFVLPWKPLRQLFGNL